MLGLCLKIEHEIEPFGRYLSLRRHDTYPMVMKHGNEKSTMAIVDYWRASPPPLPCRQAAAKPCLERLNGLVERNNAAGRKNWGNGSGFRMVLVKTTALLSWRWSIFPLVKPTMAGESTGSIIFPNLCPFSKSK